MAETIPHNRLTFGEEEAVAAARTVESGWWATGSQTQSLEQALGALAGRAHGVCVSSGIAALKLSLQAVGVGSGHQVIVPAYSCVAVPNAVLSLGAMPVPVDIDLNTFNLNADTTGQTLCGAEEIKAVVAVNSFGLPVSLDGLTGSGIPVIEDCSHGISSHWRSRPDNTIALSLGPTKYLASGGGGAVLTGNPAIAEAIRSERYYDGKAASGCRSNDLPSDIHAAIALQQTKRLGAMIERRKTLAKRYLDSLHSLAGSYGLVLPQDRDDHLWYRFVVRLPDAPADRIIAAFAEAGVTTASPVDNWLDRNIEIYPEAAAAFFQAVSLPLYPTLSDEEQAVVIDACRKAFFGLVRS